MWFLFSFFGLLLLSQNANALKCFTEYTFVRGQNVGTSMETCSGKNDYCYNVTADTNIVHKVKAAGCASIKCILSKNKCIKHKYNGKKVKLCCCNGHDLCNGNGAAELTAAQNAVSFALITLSLISVFIN